MEIKKELRSAARSLVRGNYMSRHLDMKLRLNEKMNPAEIDSYQKRCLKQTLEHATRHLPFYGHLSGYIDAKDAKKVLFEQFPIIDKQTLLANPATLYPHGGRRRPWETLGKTSGTTGTPLTIVRSLESVVAEQAFIKRQWRWVGFNRESTRVTMRGDMVVPTSRTTTPFWFWNRFDNQLLVSSRHLQEPFFDAIINRVQDLAPFALEAYPSTAYIFAQLLENRGLYLDIPWTFTASEPLYDHQKQLVSERLRTNILEMYGMAERVAFATTCEEGSLHVNPDYSYVEIVDEEGMPTDEEGYVVGTTFHNDAMPLVRYRLSDRTRWRRSECSCGRWFPTIEQVTGKHEDQITGSSGAPVSPSVLTFAFKGVRNVMKSQVAQVGRNRWEVRIVPGASYSLVDGEKLVANIHDLVDRDITVDIDVRSDIPATSAGKFRWVVNEWRHQPKPRG